MGHKHWTLADRFWPKVDKSAGATGCWLWAGAKNNMGYGKIGEGGKRGKTLLAHRVSYELANGAIPEGDGFHGVCVCHWCDSPACVNPAHLFLGTQAENMADSARKGRMDRTHKLKGTSHGSAKLTEAQVLEIRSMRGAMSQRKIADLFGIGKTTVGHIINQRNWKHL